MQKLLLLSATLLASLLIFLISCSSNRSQETITFSSQYNFEKTLHNLRYAFIENGLLNFAELDHAWAAHQVGQDLRPTTVLVVGNPIVGTPLMQEKRDIAIDLPLKVLVYEEEDGAVKVQYRKIAPSAQRVRLKSSRETAEKIDEKMLSIIKSTISE